MSHSQVTLIASELRNTVTTCRQAATHRAGLACRQPQGYQPAIRLGGEAHDDLAAVAADLPGEPVQVAVSVAVGDGGQGGVPGLHVHQHDRSGPGGRGSKPGPEAACPIGCSRR